MQLMQIQKKSSEYIGNYITTGNVHCRKGAGKNKYESIAILPKGTICVCKGGYNFAPDKTLWLYVTAGKVKGYVSTKILAVHKVFDVLTAMKKWTNIMIKDGDWIYRSSGNTFDIDKARKSNHTTDCSLTVSHALQLAGKLTKGESIYAYASAEKASKHVKRGTKNAWKEISKEATVIDYTNKKASDIKLQPGDICCWAEHVNVYISKDKWYDGGSKMTTTKKPGGKFTNFIKLQDRGKMTLYTVIRFH